MLRSEHCKLITPDGRSTSRPGIGTRHPTCADPVLPDPVVMRSTPREVASDQDETVPSYRRSSNRCRDAAVPRWFWALRIARRAQYSRHQRAKTRFTFTSDR